MSDTGDQNKINILYIAGYGFSGSTILETLLSCNSGFIGMGELVGIPRELNASYTQTLLNTQPECAEVYDRIANELDKIGESLESISELNKEEHLFSMKRKTPGQRYSDFWVTFLRAGAEKGIDVIVDSSKTAMQHARRPYLLQELEGVEVSVIHIIRHPKPILGRYKIIRERRKETGPPLIGELKYVLKTALSWSITNISTSRLTRKMDRTVRISFEKLCEDPADTIQRIELATGLRLHETLRHLKEDLPLPGTCGIAGNIRVKKEGEELRFRPSTKKVPSAGFIPALFSAMIFPIYNILAKRS